MTGTGRLATGADMAIASSPVVEIGGSPWKMLGLSVLGVIMTGLSAAVALRRFPGMQVDVFLELMGYAGAAFFGLCSVIGFWRLLTTRGPVVTITPEGIRDTRVARQFIPWSAVSRISTWEHSGQKVMVLAVNPEVERRLALTAIARWSRGANRALGADGLCVTAQGLRMDYETLLATSAAYAQRATDTH
jgi:hypothetical protein